MPAPDLRHLGTNPRLARNNFDLLRLVLASTVCLVHAYQTTPSQPLAHDAEIFLGALAVKAFFVISGFLIFMSYERSSTLASYAGKRLRRIYPAYFVVVVACLIGLSALSVLPAKEYFSALWAKHLSSDLLFLPHPTLPGVFTNNPSPFWNGSLWTIRIEVMFYCSVPLLAHAFRKIRPAYVLALVYCLALVADPLAALIEAHIGHTVPVELAREFLFQMGYFMAGATLFYYLPTFERHMAWLLAAAAAVLLVNWIWRMPLLEPMAVGITVISLALYRYAGNFGKYGDFSYGIYIVHYPLIQIALNYGWVRDSPWYFVGAVVAVTLLCSILLWHLVEKPFLKRSSHYVSG